ncbi:C16orf62 [Cordylochernes scorpioides]|uniref:C16orf62 n=1 Tax=Cordylochernes scorpioides TaxID=51811 RepID=A0ABY6LNY3_9ARAC|nr:C16orf62 [Cordylochernes scorpioides]
MQADPPESQRLEILNEVWKVVSRFGNHKDYMSCAEAWIEFPVKHFTPFEVNTFLDDIIRHLTPDRAFEHHYPELVRILEQMLSHSRNLSALLTMDRFLPFLNLLQKEPVRTEGCKMVLEAFARKQAESINDPILINALNYICKTMHDSVNALTVEDERRQISNLISHFVRKVSFGRDFEQQLSFYVEARATFSNLDSVLVQLVQSVNLLAIQTRQVVKGHHTRKTASFVKACAAYSFITIPSLVDVFSRLELYLVSGQVALLNLCLSQADAFFKAAITLLPEVPSHFPETSDGGKPRPTESHHLNYLSNFLSTLLVVPCMVLQDHPDQEPLYLVRGLLSVVQHYSWEPHSDAPCQLYLRALALFSALTQEHFLYHVNGVESNEELYGGDPKYVAEVETLASNLLEEILGHLKFLADSGVSGTSLGHSRRIHMYVPQAYRRQAALALELARVLLTHADVTQPSLATLVVNLWGLAQRHGAADTRSMVCGPTLFAVAPIFSCSSRSACFLKCELKWWSGVTQEIDCMIVFFFFLSLVHVVQTMIIMVGS